MCKTVSLKDNCSIINHLEKKCQTTAFGPWYIICFYKHLEMAIVVGNLKKGK